MCEEFFFLHRNLIFYFAINPFTTYTIIIGTLSLSSGQALRRHFVTPLVKIDTFIIAFL